MTASASIAANVLTQSDIVRETSAKNISKAPVPGSKRETVNFETQLTGSASAKKSTDNERQGQTVQGTTYSLALEGRGGIPVKTSSGELVMTRNGTSPGLDADGKYVLGNTLGASALKVQGWRMNTAGNIVDASGNAITNLNDTAKLTDIDLSAYNTYAAASQNVTLNCMLNSAQATGAGNGVSHDVTFYDAIGGSHTLTIKWVKQATGTGTYNPASANIAGCDIWNVSITYDGASVPKVGTSGGADYTNANCRDIYMKNGVIIGITTQGASNTLQTALDAVYIPFASQYNPVTLDLGLSTTGTARSVIREGATTATLTGSADGSELSERTGWTVQENGDVEVFFPKGSLVVYKIPVATVTSYAGVENKAGYWIATSLSGDLQLRKAGTGGAGTYVPGSLEDSTTDATQEAITIAPIQTQEGAAAMIIRAGQKRDDTVLSAFS